MEAAQKSYASFFKGKIADILNLLILNFLEPDYELWEECPEDFIELED